MSMGDRVTNIWKKESDGEENDVPWHLKYGGRVLGTFAGVVNILTGLWNTVGILFFNVNSLFAGVVQLFLGVLLIAIEAPFLCFYVDHMNRISNSAENKPLWIRAVLYVGISLVPFAFSFGPSTLVASALIFCTGLLYGLMSIGKKASVDQMKSTAATLGP